MTLNISTPEADALVLRNAKAAMERVRQRRRPSLVKKLLSDRGLMPVSAAEKQRRLARYAVTSVAATSASRPRTERASARGRTAEDVAAAKAHGCTVAEYRKLRKIAGQQ